MGKYKKRKDGRYATTIQLGFKPDGSPNKIFVAAKTEKDLKNKILDLQIQIKSGQLVKDANTFLKDYASDWLTTYKASAGINTRAMYRNIIDKHIIPSLGHLPLNKLRRSDVQGLINKNIEHPRTCQQIKMTLSQIFNSAIDDKLIVENPCRNIAVPKNPKKERRVLTDLEKDALLKADFDSVEKTFVMILFYFGLRRGEALALTKSDIDLKKRTLSVNKDVIFDGNVPVVKYGAKSDAGNRTIHIPSGVFPLLKEYLKQVNTFYLFPGRSYPVLSKSQYVRLWERIVKKMNDAVTTDREKLIGAEPIQGLTAHLFRHNYCTMLYYSGVSQKEAVKLMGHSDIKIIMEVYTHLDEKKEAVEEKLDNAIAL